MGAELTPSLEPGVSGPGALIVSLLSILNRIAFLLSACMRPVRGMCWTMVWVWDLAFSFLSGEDHGV